MAVAIRSAVSTTPTGSSAQNNVVTLSNNFGEQTEIYNGVDFSVNLRLPGGAVLQGGTSTGRVTTNNCFVVDSPQQTLNCDVTPPFQTQVKLLGVYPWPWWGIQTSATIQSLPGPSRSLRARSYSSAEVLAVARTHPDRRQRQPSRLSRPGRCTAGASTRSISGCPRCFRFGGGTPRAGQRRPLQPVQREPDPGVEHDLRNGVAAAASDPPGTLAEVWSAGRLLMTRWSIAAVSLVVSLTWTALAADPQRAPSTAGDGCVAVAAGDARPVLRDVSQRTAQDSRTGAGWPRPRARRPERPRSGSRSSESSRRERCHRSARDGPTRRATRV